MRCACRELLGDRNPSPDPDPDPNPKPASIELFDELESGHRCTSCSVTWVRVTVRTSVRVRARVRGWVKVRASTTFGGNVWGK